MRIDVIGRQIDITEAIREHSESKLSKLGRFSDRMQLITMTLGKEGSHGHESFEVEIVIDVAGHDTIVSRVLGDDLYGLIEQASQKATRQLKDFKEQLKPGHHR